MKIPIPDENPKFNMAPMIDMVFLLLVFFMCASKISRSQKMTMQIPEATKAVVPEERPERWIVNIALDEDDPTRTRSKLYSGEVETTIDELVSQIEAQLAVQPDLSVYIRADANTEHKEIKKVMNSLAAIGMDNFIFGTYKPDK